MLPFTIPQIIGLIALTIVVIAILFKLYGATLRNFVIIVVGVMLITLVLLKQTEITYYTHVVLHAFNHTK